MVVVLPTPLMTKSQTLVVPCRGAAIGLAAEPGLQQILQGVGDLAPAGTARDPGPEIVEQGGRLLH
jgi:hypothetical protein